MERRRSLGIVVAVALCFGVSCHRTHYVHLYGSDDSVPVSHAGAEAEHISSWQNFFLFGWIPGERVIESGHACGEQGVAEVHTEQSFLQGLVAALTSFYINIYSPWTGETVCR